MPASLLERYEFHSYHHAATILASNCQDEFNDLLHALDNFTLTLADITRPGGNESEIPKKLSAILRPRGWQEVRVQGDLVVRRLVRNSLSGTTTELAHTLANYIDGHNIDYVRHRVAFDMEWNSKDQTFDRDLIAFDTFARTGVISAGVLLTRSAELDPVFRRLGPGIRNKYGSSTTWMGKLLPRLDTGRNGSCPVLAIGIRPACITDLADLPALPTP